LKTSRQIKIAAAAEMRVTINPFAIPKSKLKIISAIAASQDTQKVPRLLLARSRHGCRK
jgi:hypothetical protein